MSHEIKRLIAEERRAALGCGIRAIFARRRAERVRWRGLRAWHLRQMEKWRARL